jgi:Zn-dependent protease
MSGIPVARIAGFEIRLHLSWVFIIAIVSATVASRLTAAEPETPALGSWLIGLGASLGFLVSVVAHELAHHVVARRDGAGGEVIVVHFIGSPAAVDVRASSPRAEAAAALAGPLVSLVLGIGLIVVSMPGLTAPSAIVRGLADAAFIVGALDLILAAISLVPAFPVDGGRLVRAVAWARSGDPRQGTRVAGAVGRWVGRVVLVAGLVVILAGDTLDGIMLGLVGWFLGASARSVDRWLVLDELIAGIRVDEALEPRLETLSPQLTLDTFAQGVLDGSVSPALAVVRDDELLGMVGAAQLRRIPRRDWPSTRTEDVMVGRADLPLTEPGDALADAVERLRGTPLDGLPVFEGADLRGIFTRRSVAAALHRKAEALGMTL